MLGSRICNLSGTAEVYINTVEMNPNETQATYGSKWNEMTPDEQECKAKQ